ncbi:MAG: hypothetical protein PHI12_13995 [Dehalococcoidales bacterium]|nr:hypothetical protein [Dehalococcoidales bacterium]
MPRKTIKESLCPYYFRKCLQSACTEVPKTTDPETWKKGVDKLGSCPHAGANLTQKDYRSRQEYIEEKKTKEK